MYLSNHPADSNLQEHVPFLLLPPEVRNKVYRELLAPANTSGALYINETLVQPGLCRVSKQVRKEVLSIFYGENDFSLMTSVNPHLISSCLENGISVIRTATLVKILERLSAGGKAGVPGTSSLQHITKIAVWVDTYKELVIGKELVIILRDVPLEEGDLKDVVWHKKPYARIGGKEMDWKDSKRVKAAYRAAFSGIARSKYTYHKNHEVAEILCILARECPNATGNVSIYL